MNSSFLAIHTPQKKLISSKSSTPLESCKSDFGRFSPSRDMIKLLQGLNRVHQFQYHKEVSMVDMKDMKILTKILTTEVGKCFNSESPDVPDIVQKLESIAMDDGTYTSFLKYFIAEEFLTPVEYSFSIFTVLNYMCLFSVSFDDAFKELFQLPSSESVCELCSTSMEKDKKLVCDQFNFSLIQKNMGRDDYDDSFDDSDYKNDMDGNEYSSSFSEEEPVEDDVYNFSEAEEQVKLFVFNPFDKSPLQGLPAPVSCENLNSTKCFNPFSIKDKGPKKSPKVDTGNVTCPHCDHSFTSKHNMKQHIISVHKITEPGMKVFKCKVKKCTFVTGSRVWFERHNCEKKNKEVVLKPECAYCKETFANTSSLRRHINRLHKKGRWGTSMQTLSD